jgi:hypothetical protein
VTRTHEWRNAVAVAAALVALGTGVPVSAATPRQPAVCTRALEEGATSRVSLESVASAAGDSKRTVQVCIRTARGTSVGSFHLVIEYDSSTWQTVGFVPAAEGNEVANLTRPGRADIAGAAPDGFANGTLLRLVIVRSDGRRTSEGMALMNLRLLELNATDGSDLKAHSIVAGLAGIKVQAHSAVAPVHTAPGDKAPHIDRLDPARATFVPGALIQLMIIGSGFRPEGNVVLVGEVAIGELPSGDGQRLRLMLPESFPPVGEVPPRRLEPGAYDISVRTGAGTSNRMQFVLERPR